MNQLRIWMDRASQEEKRALAKLAGTTVGTLQQVAGGYRSNGEASVRSALARRLEEAAAVLNRANKNLPPLYRTDLSPECRGCDFAQKCLGPKAAQADFEVVAPT